MLAPSAPPAPAGRDARDRQSRARAPAISRNAPPGRSARMGPAAALLGGSIRPRRSSRGAVRKLAARPLVALVPTADPEGPGGHSPRAVGPRVWPKGRGPTLGAQAHSPLVRDSGRRARTRRFTHCALPWQRPTLGGPTQSPVRTLQSERLALGSADANGTNRSDRRPAGRHAPMPPSRMTVVVAHSRARVRRAPAARGDDADADAPLCCSRSCCCAGALAALRPCWLRCTALAATGCSGLLPVATGCGRLQQVVMHCNRLSRAATDRARCAVTMLLRCAALAAIGCTGLRSVAKG